MAGGAVADATLTTPPLKPRHVCAEYQSGMLTFRKSKRERGTRIQPVPTPPAPDRHPRTERYLTDGVELYRLLGAVARGACELIGMENCRSLEIVLVPISELRLGRLRFVTTLSRDATMALGV